MRIEANQKESTRTAKEPRESPPRESTKKKIKMAQYADGAELQDEANFELLIR